MRPGEKAVPFTMNERLPDEVIDFIEGEFEIDQNGLEVVNRKGESYG